MSTSGRLKYDKYLTDLSQSNPIGNKIGTIVAPIKSVSRTSDTIFVDSRDALDQINDDAESTPSGGVDFTVGTPISYRTLRKAVHTVIKDKERDNTDPPVMLNSRTTNKLAERLALKHERRVVTQMETSVTQGETVGAGEKWDTGTPVLEDNIIEAKKEIWDNTGLKANSIVIPYAAGLYAANMDFIKNTLQYQFGMQIVSTGFQGESLLETGLPPLIKGLRVIVSDGQYNTMQKGAAASYSGLWGNDVWIGHIPPNLGIDTMWGFLTLEYEGKQTGIERMTDPKGDKIVHDWDYVISVGDANAWYRLQDVIA